MYPSLRWSPDEHIILVLHRDHAASLRLNIAEALRNSTAEAAEAWSDLMDQIDKQSACEEPVDDRQASLVL